MNDHNLDDLIINDIQPKSNKTKSFLTILALMIIVLIVAIILTRIILKDSKPQTPVAKENSIELISPELTLQQPAEPKTAKKEPSLSDIAQSEPKAPVQTKTTQETLQTIKDSEVKIEVKHDTKSKKELQREYAQVREERLKAQSSQPKAEKRQEAEKTKKATREIRPVREESVKPGQRGEYYIQVGSFRQTPSKQFLGTIEKHGFKHTITTPGKSGIKRLLVGPYPTKASANHALPKVKDLILKGAFVTKR